MSKEHNQTSTLVPFQLQPKPSKNERKAQLARIKKAEARMQHIQSCRETQDRKHAEQLAAEQAAIQKQQDKERLCTSKVAQQRAKIAELQRELDSLLQPYQTQAIRILSVKDNPLTWKTKEIAMQDPGTNRFMRTLLTGLIQLQKSASLSRVDPAVLEYFLFDEEYTTMKVNDLYGWDNISKNVLIIIKIQETYYYQLATHTDTGVRFDNITYIDVMLHQYVKHIGNAKVEEDINGEREYQSYLEDERAWQIQERAEQVKSMEANDLEYDNAY